MAGSLEGNKLVAAVLTAGIVGVGSAVFAGILYHPHQLEEPVYRVEAAATEGGGEAAPAAEAQPIGVLLASANVGERARRRPRNAPPATASSRAAPTRSAPACGAWSTGRSPRTRASATRAALAEKSAASLGLRSAQPVPDQPQGLRPRHQDELRRHQQGSRARRRHRLPALAGRRARRRCRAADGRPPAWARRRLPRVRGAGPPAGRRRGRGPAPLLPHAGRGRDQARREPGHDRRPRGRGARCAS